MNSNAMRVLSNELNTSTTDWMRARNRVLDQNLPATYVEVEEFLAMAIQKRNDAQALVDLLMVEADRKHNEFTR